MEKNCAGALRQCLQKKGEIKNMLDGNTGGMITYHQEVGVMAKFTVSVPDGMLELIERLMAEWNTTRSGVVAELLRWYGEQKTAELMAEGYRAAAEESCRQVEEYLPAQAEVVLRD